MAEETREFRLPDLGEGLTEAEVVRWLVAEGQQVALNQPLVEVETEKALVEIPSPFAGTVEKLHGQEGDRVEVGRPLVSIRTSADAPRTGRREVLVGYGPDEEGGRRRRRKPIGRRNGADATVLEPPQAEPPEFEPPAVEEAPPEPPAVQAAPPEPAAATVHALATPPVRKLARDLGVDIDMIPGTGPGGRVTREDVVAAAEGAGSPVVAEEPVATRAAEAVVAPAGAAAARSSVAAAADERIPVRAIRRAIAEKMVRSATSIPHVTEWVTLDASELMELRAGLNASPEAAAGKISPLPILVKALTMALRAHPLVNSRWDDDTQEIVVKHVYHVGIATDTDRGLLVPVVRDADRLSVFELAREIGRLVSAARDGSIGPGELTGSTITVTNVGSFGMDAGTPIINHPECAILATGAITKRPWVVGDQVVPRDVMTIALSFDHRIVDGAEAGRFLRRLADLIEHPARLFGLL